MVGTFNLLAEVGKVDQSEINRSLTIVLCIGVPGAVTIVAAILGTRARLRLANRLDRMHSNPAARSKIELIVARYRWVFILGAVVAASYVVVGVAAFAVPDFIGARLGVATVVALFILGFVVSLSLWKLLRKVSQDE